MDLTKIKYCFSDVCEVQNRYSSRILEIIDSVVAKNDEAIAKLNEASSSTTTQGVIFDLNKEFEEMGLAKLNEASSSTTTQGVIFDLNKEFEEIGLLGNIGNCFDALVSGLGNLSKLVDGSFTDDLEDACMNFMFDSDTVSEIIECYLHTLGLEEPDKATLYFPDLGEMRAALELEDVVPALKWVNERHFELKGNGSDVETRLVMLEYTDILKSFGKKDADRYLSESLSYLEDAVESALVLSHDFRSACSMSISEYEQKSPCKELLSSDRWKQLNVDFARQYFLINSQTYKNLLYVLIEAGFQALPPLLEHVRSFPGSLPTEPGSKLPLLAELDRELSSCPRFVCQISCNEAHLGDPPIRLLCGHVVLRSTLPRLRNISPGSTFCECPYCKAIIIKDDYWEELRF